MTLTITNVRLAHSNKDDSSRLYTVQCEGGIITDIFASDPDKRLHEASSVGNLSSDIVDGKGGILIPSSATRIILQLAHCALLDCAIRIFISTNVTYWRRVNH